jgi:phosphatidylglycerol lysyltransferase
MKPLSFLISIKHFFKKNSLSFIHENGRMAAQFILTLLFIALGIWFVKHEKAELHEVIYALSGSLWQYILLGITMTIAYIILQGLMYKASFAALKTKVSLGSMIVLFLKRNFISVFLPAGGVSSLAFFTNEIEKKGITKSQIHFASSVYGFVGILSVVIVAIPAFLYALLKGRLEFGELMVLTGVIALLIFVVLLFRSVTKDSKIRRLLTKYFPSITVLLDEFRNNKINNRQLLLTIFFSVIIELAGIAHLFIAMAALKLNPSVFAAVIGYLVSVLFLIISPFLRGLGAIELSMTYILTKFGYSNVEAISITLLYRFFEFWLPLVAGIFSFFIKINKLLMRVVPALLLFLLGIINVISSLTPAIDERVIWLQNFIPVDAINASKYFVLAAGLFLLITAAFMLKGLRTAWWMALLLSIISFTGHITKAIDYEEATVAFFIFIILLVTRKEYNVRSNPRLRNVGLRTAVLSITAVLIYGFIGFYFLDKKYFNIDFSWHESIYYTLRNYFLLGSKNLVPADAFARDFLYTINISGLLSMSFLFYTLIRPYVIKNAASPEQLIHAKNLTKQFGCSGLDYFKTYNDKMIFAPEGVNAFVSFKISGNYTIVLEDPVAENIPQMKDCITQFDLFCHERGLKSIFYRVPEASLPVYKDIQKNSLFLGQEGVVDLRSFTLEGSSNKPLRNALNKMNDKGLKCNIHVPPVKDGLLQKIKSVSDEWLDYTDYEEIVFSQGMFLWEELKQQTLITVENNEEKIIAFLNVIPDYAQGEITYDLIRKTADAPNGVMDFIMIELFKYAKTQGYLYVNLGFAPLSGLEDPHSFSERSMKFAYEKIKSFSHYKGLRDFKEKFSPVWYNKYLVYDNDYDLLQVPLALSKVIKA